MHQLVDISAMLLPVERQCALDSSLPRELAGRSCCMQLWTRKKERKIVHRP